MDRIFLSGIRVFGFHGLTDEERSVGQVLEVDVELRMDLRHAGRTDVLEHSADWTDVYTIAREAAVSYTHLRAHETPEHLVCRLLLEKKKPTTNIKLRKLEMIK